MKRGKRLPFPPFLIIDIVLENDRIRKCVRICNDSLRDCRITSAVS